MRKPGPSGRDFAATTGNLWGGSSASSKRNDPLRGFRRCGLDYNSNRTRLFNDLHGEHMRPASRYNTIQRVR